jgi:hypothetical protein
VLTGGLVGLGLVRYFTLLLRDIRGLVRLPCRLFRLVVVCSIYRWRCVVSAAFHLRPWEMCCLSSVLPSNQPSTIDTYALCMRARRQGKTSEAKVL